jgi:formamidopyrimidine-DNA glycosylase
MPEGPEITVLSQFLATKLMDRTLEKMDILSGKYSKNEMKNYELLDGKVLYTIKNIDSKGKLMWMVLENQNNGKNIYLTSNLGLTGFWGFDEGKSDRLKFTIHNEDNTKKYFLYYEDARNFGNIGIYDDLQDFYKKVGELAPDSLKEKYSIDDFVGWYKTFLKKTKKRSEQNIALVLMKQKKDEGIVSGIGNYLMAEILYESKISPHRTVGSLSDEEIENLGKAIQHLTKLSYYNNMTGYMTHFEDFIDLHKERIYKGIYPDFHSHIKLKKNEKFQFKVYRQKKDPDGNTVEADKSIQKTRSTYWVPGVQRESPVAN